MEADALHKNSWAFSEVQDFVGFSASNSDGNMEGQYGRPALFLLLNTLNPVWNIMTIFMKALGVFFSSSPERELMDKSGAEMQTAL